MTIRRLATAAYSYSALHILAWRVVLSSSHNETWFPAFSKIVGVVFLPLNLLAGGLCRLAWGSLNLFEAKVIFGIWADMAVASLLSVTLVLGLVVWLKNRQVRTDGHA